MNMWQWTRVHLEKLWRYKWPLAFLILTVGVDYYFIVVFLSSIPSIEEQTKLITPLATFNSILLAGAGIMYQVQATKEREMEFKIHQQRREIYLQLLDFIAKLFGAIKSQGSTVDATTIINHKEFLDLHFKMIPFASKEVIEIYSKIKNPDTEALNKDPGAWAILNLGRLFKQMRKEIGFQEGYIPVRQLLSLWMTDVYDKKYDVLFMKLE